MTRATLAALALIAAGLFLLPWYALQDGLFDPSWLAHWTGRDAAPAVLQAALHGKAWLWPLIAVFVGAVAGARGGENRERGATLLLGAGCLGLVYLLAQGFAIGLKGPAIGWLAMLAGEAPWRQFGLGAGAVAAGAGFLILLAQGIAGRRGFGGDAFVAGAVLAVGTAVGLFAFYPVAKILATAIEGASGAFDLSAFWQRLAAPKIWSLECLSSARRCGVAWNTIVLAVAVGAGTTVLGLAFALIATRTAFPAKRVLRLLTVLPIICAPFVIGLGLILVFGQAGIVNALLEGLFGIQPTRWIYGFQGVFLAQLFAFTPIAFLILIGVVEGVSPSLEEAAATLRAKPGTVFASVSLPLMRPGLANAFLVGFIESIADFGNPLILGGNFGVLSTEIYFAVVGAQYDQGRAATLGLILLALALAAFLAQRRFLGRASYVTVGGKGFAGRAAPMPGWAKTLSFGIAMPWAAFTLLLYVMVLAGGFVEIWGRDNSFTLRHYAKAFEVQWSAHGPIWSGVAWNSLTTTLVLAAVAAPLTAGLGLIAGWLIARKEFPGRRLFEFATMLSFAIPGTVIGVAYILAFNLPPIELTGSAMIIVLCFVFRNMPVGVRAGIAAVAQLDKSLDEASATLGARGGTTFARIVLPLLRPAAVAALIYSFIRAMTTVSAVIFLVTAEYDLATAFIVGRVVNGDYGVAIAYSSALTALMVLAILAIQALVGERRLGRRAPPVPAGARA